MGSYHDPSSKKLEGMATVSQDADSLTVATRHFSSFLLSAIDKTLLKKDLDTSFRPGIDDWQSPNYGSYGDDSPYTVTVTGTTMTWQSIEIASAKFTFKK
jgi:hypothetical protein